MELPLANDIALLKLKAKPNGRGIIFGNKVIPACLPPENALYGKDLSCSVAGWGTTAHGPKDQISFSRYLQTARIPYIETSKCIQDDVYGPRKGIQAFIFIILFQLSFISTVLVELQYLKFICSG